LLKTNPEIGELSLVYSIDGEGNRHKNVIAGPEIGHFDGDNFYGKCDFKEWDLKETDINAICIN